MKLWRPPHETRGTMGYWWNSARLMAVTVSGLAAKLFYDHFNVIPGYVPAANDADHLRW